MNILMIHQNGGTSGGGGGQIAMFRLHEGLRRAGAHSTIACRKRQCDSDEFIELPRSDRMESILGAVSWRLGLNDVHCVSSFKIKRFQPFLDADVVHIQGIHTNFFNYLALPGLSRLKPMIFTLHDMWAMTGHCSQSYECERWRTGCGRCPHLDVYPPLEHDGTALEWRLKNWAYKRAQLTLISPSRWLANLARQSILNRFDIRHIPNGVDTSVFKPLDRAACRQQLGLPQDKLVIMFAAAALNNPAKGSDLLLPALSKLPAKMKERCILLLAGAGFDSLTLNCGIPAVKLGFISEDEQKAVAYSAADLFVLPSRAENHSLVLLESLACGTPAVAFNVGGNPEIVKHMQTGYLALNVSEMDLHLGIMQLLQNDDLRRRLAVGARQLICDEFSMDQHVQRHLTLYEEVLAPATKPQPALA